METNSPTARPQSVPDSADRSENFHVSIAWNLTEPAAEWVSLVQSMDIGSHIRSPQASFDAVKARVGNTVHNFDLGSRKNSLVKARGSLGLG